MYFQVRLLLEWGAEVMVIDNKGKLPLHLVGQSASQKNRGKSEDIKKLLKNKMPTDDDQGENHLAGVHTTVLLELGRTYVHACTAHDPFSLIGLPLTPWGAYLFCSTQDLTGRTTPSLVAP